MSNVNGHPIPKELRERFSSIEDDAQRLSGAGVFTQMRTAVQAYFSKSQAVATNVTAEPCAHDFRIFSSECAKCGADWIPGKDYSPVDPVPPAGGKPDPIIAVLKGHLADGMNPMFSGGDLKHLIGLLEAGTRLQAEVEQWKQGAKVEADAGDEARAELTKARELLEIGHISNTPGWREAVATYLSNQSAPADKGQGEPVAVVLAEAREWLGDGKHADGLAREHWTPEYAALIDRIDATLSK